MHARGFATHAYALSAHKPDEPSSAIILRDGTELEVDVTLRESPRR